MAEFLPELVTEVTKEFERHLDLPNNSRIIFSGRFGLGKTSFLENYFETNEDKYYTIRLAPVNYSVASNEDIFRYIKYDILRSILSDEKLQLQYLDFKKWEVLPFFLRKHFKDIVKGTLTAISKLGPAKAVGIDAIYKELQTLYEKLDEFQNESNKGDKKEVDSFQKLLETEDGSLYEYNVITSLISEGLGNVTEKENVLIIDDLDRIDPDHIFRLFNVFAAHVDFKDDQGDKFGFDKVIFVCDVENIQSIFHHRYGSRTDFSGYIDKFYSTKVFYFDNKNDVKRLVKNYVNLIDFPESNQKWNEGAKNRISEELFYILESFRVNGSYNLRNLLNKDSNFKIEAKKIYLKDGSDRNSMQIVSAIVIEILLTIFGDIATLKKHLEGAFNKWDTVNQFVSGKLNNAFLLYFIEEHRLLDKTVTLHKGKINFDLTIDKHFHSGIKYAKLEKEETYRSNSSMFDDEFKEDMNLFRLYQGCINTLVEQGIIA